MADNPEPTVERKTIEIDEQVTVGQLAELLSIPVSQLITELLKNGVMATVNEKLDFDTSQIIVSEMKLPVELAKKVAAQAPARVKPVADKDAKPRPPVVAMMGHVDHGKTSLMDAIRGADVVKGEAGGITQHLSAFQIDHKGRKLTLIDTPGHEAFSALREHGARLTDVAVIVVAADEGVKPQTLEAIRFAKQAGVKMIVAASKMDKADANLDKLKQELAANDLNPEEWGGETIVMPVSAKEKTGLNELLDMILLVADVEELKARDTGPATGLVIESHMEKGRGSVAVAMIEQGLLHPGDFVIAGSTYAKVRNLESTDGQPLESAGPSTPVVITGLKELPEFGDEFEVVADEKAARARSGQSSQAKKQSSGATASSSSELLSLINRTNKLSEFNVVVKADVQGSLTSVVDSLKTLDNEEVAVRIVSSGVGVITENDVHTAIGTEAVIYGFHVDLPTSVKRTAQRDKVTVRLYTVIYELIDDVKKELEARLSPEIVEEELGTLIVKGIFKVTRTAAIIGGEVSKGRLALPAIARLKRKKDIIAEELEIVGLKSGPTDVSSIETGQMGGVSIKTETKLDVVEGDHLEVYARSSKMRSL